MGEMGTRSTSMTPTLAGRIQTRIFLTWTIGLVLSGFYTLVYNAFMPDPPTIATIAFWELFLILIYVTLIGIILDFAYIFIQSFHWDRDWPLGYQFLTGFIEGIIVFWLFFFGLLPGTTYNAGDWWRFWLAYGTIWVTTWWWVFGPMRIFFLRWRFRGGQFF